MEKQQFKRNNGGIWESKDKNKETYFSGSVELDGQNYKFKAFKNKNKKPGERTPDYQIFLDEAPVEKKRELDRTPIKRSDDESIPF